MRKNNRFISLFFLICAAICRADTDQEPLLTYAADPDVLSDGKYYYLTYTQSKTRVLPILRSTDTRRFSEFKTYDPGAVDPDYDYYTVWAPSLAVWDKKYILLFSAIRLPKGEPGKDYGDFVREGRETTTFYATADSASLRFSKPVPLNSSLSRKTAGSFEYGNSQFDGDPEQIVRIDPYLYCEKSIARLFYVWFHHGNNISSVTWPDLTKPTPHIRPTEPSEENITEAPFVFKRNGIYYLLYSHGHFTRNYGMSYVMADSLEKLSKRRKVYPLYRATYSAEGALIRNGGHCAVTEYRGETVVFYHQGFWKISKKGKKSFVRNVYREILTFESDGTIQPLN
ncbi:MAG: family 43 glycosylhydrolase [Kiritimatiellales bacterium]